MCEIKELSIEPCVCARSKNSQENLACVRDQITLKVHCLCARSKNSQENLASVRDQRRSKNSQENLASVRDQRTLKSTLLVCEIK